MKTFVSIYALSDPAIPRLWKYIGATRQLLKTRLSLHCSESKCIKRAGGRFSKKEAWLFWLLSKGRKPVITQLEACSETEARIRELNWIEKFRPGGFLTNGYSWKHLLSERRMAQVGGPA